MREIRKNSGGRARDFKSLPFPQTPLPTRIWEPERRAFGPTFRPLMKLIRGWGRGLGRGGRGPRPLAPSPKDSISNHTGKRPAVFLDRDGTINEEMGYINHVSRFRLLPDAGPAIRRLNEAGLPVVVITNQSGAARGYFPPALVEEVHNRMQNLLAAQGARVDAIYTCLHAPNAGCSCRKPQPGLLFQAAQELNLDLSRSYLVGDRYKDIETAANAGVQGILVLTGYGRGEYEHFHDSAPAPPVHVAQNLLEAAEFIISVYPETTSNPSLF